MKVEAMEPAHSGRRVRVRFDNGETLPLSPALIAELGLYVGQELSDAALESIRDSAGEASAKERAVRIVSAAPVSEAELERRLVQKGEREEHAQQAVQWLKELRLIDDSQTAAQIVRSGAARGYGAARIRQMLYEKRIPKELWEDALAQMPEQDAAIDAFLRRRFGGKTPDRDECRRATEALLRRGHAWADIRQALSRYAPDEEFED